ncbi:MAG: hypothetical protein SO072_02735 [Dysosmobacter sp.]|nr:hypothetical protein [Dysosmobacter sp.]
MKKSEIQEAVQRELEIRRDLIRKMHEKAKGAPDWKKESLRKCAMSYADEACGVLSVMRRLEFLDFEQNFEQMLETTDEFKKAARAVGKEEPEYEAC